MSETNLIHKRRDAVVLSTTKDSLTVAALAQDWLAMHAQLSRVRTANAKLRDSIKRDRDAFARGMRHAIVTIERAMEGE